MQEELSSSSPSSNSRDSRAIDYILRLVEDGNAAVAPDQFLRLLTRRLAAALEVRSAFVSEVAEGWAPREKLVVLWNGSRYVEAKAPEGDETPWALAARDGVSMIPKGLEQMRGPEWVAGTDAVSCTAVALFSHADFPIGWLGILHDQPLDDSEARLLVLKVFAGRTAAEVERARLHQQLAESEERHRRLVENSPDVIYRFRLHPDVGIDYMNGAGERLFGHSLEYLRNMDIDQFLALAADDDERTDLRQAIAEARFEQSRTRRWRRADGTVITTEQHNVPMYDGTGRMIAMEGTIRDVTDREKALKALQESEDAQRRLIESLPDLMLRLDAEANFLEVIPTASTSFRSGGSDMEGIIGSLSDARALKAVRQAVRTGSPQRFRQDIEVDRQERTYEFRVVALRSGEVLAIVRDMTGELWAAAEADRRIARDELEGVVERQIGIRNPYHLTFREFTVLHLVAKGAPDKEIANNLGIAISTVNKHVSNILGKLNATSRTEAGVRAVQERLVSV